jgi:ABC transporter DrrB family efflux protein
MTATALDPALLDTTAGAGLDDTTIDRARRWAKDVAVLARRNLIHVRREPAQMSDATVQPVLFTVLFVYIFGSSMVIPGGGSYKDFAIGGLLTMNVTTASMGTAVGLSSDLSTGVINRFRTLPMARSSILAGRTMSDLVASVLCGSIVLITGFVIGWRPNNGIGGVLLGLAVAVVFAYALSWFTSVIGLSVSDPESAQAVGLIILFPLSFVSTCFVPSQGLPSWLRVIADWNPISAVAGAARNLFGNPNPASAVSAWPAQHPEIYALLSSVVIIAICAPIASRLLRQRTTD